MNSALASAVRDRRLPAEGRGVLAFLWLGRSEATVNPASLSAEFSTGRDRMARIINELVAAGYLERRCIRSAGAFAGVDYRLVDGLCAPLAAKGARGG
ncbi:MAG TPA: hypothetical protein VNX29_16105 [Kaistia sp.]|nr:hypothetical protein [Kaistia sp.]